MILSGMNLDEYYRSNPDLREFYVTLPGIVQAQILHYDVPVTTKGELQKLAEYFSHDI